MNKYLIIGILLIIAVGGFFLFNNSSPANTNNQGNKLAVAASFYPLYYFASEIGGEKTEVRNLTPAGVEPHDYEPGARDIASLEESDLLIVNSAGFEPWFEKIKEDLLQNNVHIVEATENLTLLEGDEEHEEEHANEEASEEDHPRDPHVWLDPVLAKEQVSNITEGYIAVDPQNTAYYKENEKQLISRLDELDQKFKQGLNNCQSNNIITTHIAFAYLAKRYGLNQVAIAGLSPDEEPSAARLAAVSDFARENNVEYIFFETLVSPKLAETIASEVGAETLVLDPLEGLSDDDMSSGKNYFTVMEDNLKNLQTALQCST
jgi:zinc transport system substrate-binding protein